MNLSIALLLSRLAVRNVLRNRWRSFLTLLMATIGIGCAVLMAALARGMAQQMTEEAIFNLTGHVQIQNPQYRDDPSVENSFPDPNNFVDKLPNDVRWAKRVRVPGIVLSERESVGIELVGIIPEAEAGLSIAGEPVSAGKNLKSSEDEGVIIGKALADHLQTSLGKRVVVMSQNGANRVVDRGFRIIGVFDSELESTEKAYAFFGLTTLQKLLEIPGTVTELSLITESLEVDTDLLSLLKREFPGLSVASWKESEPLIDAITRLQGGFLLIWFVIVVIVIGFGLVNTVFMSIFERTREIGVVIAIGMRPRWMILQTMLESGVLLVLGGIAGTLLGLGGVSLLKEGIDVSAFAAGTAQMGVGSVIVPHVLWQDVQSLNFVLLTIGLLGSLYPAWIASRKDPLRSITVR